MICYLMVVLRVVQFVCWPGKHAVVSWLDLYLTRIYSTFGLPYDPNAVVVQAFPWASLTISNVVRVYASQTWDGQLDVSEFASMLQRLLGLGGTAALSLSARLFPGLDRDNSGLLDFPEMFIGMVMLCSDGQQAKLNAVFDIIDSDRSGRISRTELEEFLVHIAPWHTTRAELRSVASRVMREADANNSGYITFMEVSMACVIYAGCWLL